MKTSRSAALALTSSALVLVFLVFGRDSLSYVTTALAELRGAVKENVPLEFELERARQMIAGLEPEVARNMRLIVQEEVQIENLEKRLDEREALLRKSESDILRLKNDLDLGHASYRYDGGLFTADQVKTELAARFARFKSGQASQDQLRQVLAARTRGLEAARGKLEAMLAAKRQLEIDVENLEARMKMVEVAETTNNLNFNDSHLARTRELIGDLGTRIEVAERFLDAEAEGPAEIDLGDPDVENISEAIASHFGLTTAPRAPLAKSRGK